MQSTSSQSGLQSRRLERTSTPGVFKRGGRYVVVFRDGFGRQRKHAARTLAEARTLKASLTADVHRGEFRETSRITFADYAAEWIATYQGRTSRGFGEGSRSDYRRALGLDEKGKPTDDGAIAFFGRGKSASSKPPGVLAHVAGLDRSKTPPSSVRKNIAPLRALFATALEDGAIRSNPVVGIRIAGVTDHVDSDEVKALTEDELRPRHRREPRVTSPRQLVGLASSSASRGADLVFPHVRPPSIWST